MLPRKPRCLNPKDGDLPLCRTEPLRPFLKCGVDLGGPIVIKRNPGRTTITLKT
ncbi:hypothetical protein HHI36_024013, partial [Cryptolaemus montrouzieri]